MGPLSSYEVEDICETVYYQAIELMNRHEYADSVYQFQNRVEQDFKDWAYPKFNWRIHDSDKQIVLKWQSKIRAEAKRWYEENVERKREEERESERREQENREREEQYERDREAHERRRREEDNRRRQEEERWEAEARRREQELEEKEFMIELEQVETSFNKKVQELSEDCAIDVLNGTIDYFNDELAAIEERLDDFSSSHRAKFEEKIDGLTKICNKVIAKRDIELKAIRKAKNEANMKKLAEIQSVWQAQLHQPSNSSTGATTKLDTSHCLNCGNEVSATTKFCTQCGAKLIAKCSNCGVTLKPSAKFCTQCGTAVN